MKEGIVFELDQSSAVIMTRDGEFLSVSAKPDWKIGDTVKVTDFERKTNQTSGKRTSKNIWKNKSILIALVASLLFVMIPFSTISEASTFVTLDINPSIQIELKQEKVIDLKPLNDDAKNFIIQLDFKGDYGNLYEVTAKIIEKAEQMDYLKFQSSNIIMIGVLDEKALLKIDKYKQFIEESLANKKLEAEVMVFNATKKDKDIADNKGISIGKYILQENEKEKGIIITDDQLKKDNIGKIMQEIKAKNDKNNKDKNKSDKDDLDNKDKEKDDENGNGNKKGSENSVNKSKDNNNEDHGKSKEEEKNNKGNNGNRSTADRDENNNIPFEDNDDDSSSETISDDSGNDND